MSPLDTVALLSASMPIATDLTIRSAVVCTIGVVAVELGELTEVPDGVVAVAAAVLTIEPASTSTWETT